MNPSIVFLFDIIITIIFFHKALCWEHLLSYLVTAYISYELFLLDLLLNTWLCKKNLKQLLNYSYHSVYQLLFQYYSLTWGQISVNMLFFFFFSQASLPVTFWSWMVQVCSCFVFKSECYAVRSWTEIKSGMLPNGFNCVDGLAKVDL